MTRRSGSRKTARSVKADDFPALSDFLAGYLHEDFAQEHGTPDAAVRAFAADASGDEMERVRGDAARFAATIKDWPWSDARLALQRLGAAWAPRSRAALDAWLTMLASPPRD
jgi:hypothetical protein